MRLIIDCDPGNGVPAPTSTTAWRWPGAGGQTAAAAGADQHRGRQHPREVGFAVATELLAQSGYQVPVALGAARA